MHNVKNMESLVSVQLTPFQTPSMSFVHRSSTNSHSHTNSNSSSSSPLAHQHQHPHPPPHSAMDEDRDADAAQLEAITEADSSNVFSRLANPRHYVGTSRTKAQEQDTRKHGLARVAAKGGGHGQAQQAQVYQVRQVHQKGVFQRLHSTSIRNTRLHLNSSCNGEEQMNFNSSILSVPDDDHPHAPATLTGMLLAEPARVVRNDEIAKKPQRVSKAGSSMLVNPVRILSPDD